MITIKDGIPFITNEDTNEFIDFWEKITGEEPNLDTIIALSKAIIKAYRAQFREQIKLSKNTKIGNRSND